ncbi:MAG: hypothetical protein GX787_10150 [Tissierellia bacterium]|nr:hypothetical protein [Tissierellia bacterium]
MNLSKKPFIIILIILIAVIGCTNTPKDNGVLEETNKRQEGSKVILEKEDNINVAEIEKPMTTTRKNIIDTFLEKLPFDATIEDLAAYIKDNIANATEEEADNMIQWLIIYQDETISEIQEKFWESEYHDALFEYMGGIFNGVKLDESKVNNIENENIRNDFISLRNSLLTIYLYDGYFDAVVETNWDELMKYSSYLSHDLREIIRINMTIRNFDYHRNGHDIPGISKDIIILEKIIKNNKSAFIKKMATDLWHSLLHDLLFGPELIYIDEYYGENREEYKSIMELRTIYPDSLLKEILEDVYLIELEEEEDIYEVSNIIGDIIEKKLQFGLTSNNYFNIKSVKNQEGKYDLVEIGIPADLHKQNRINHIIKLDREQFIQNLANDKKFRLSSDIGLTNDRYISYNYSLSVVDSNSNENNFYSYRTLDYMEEKYVTLEDYLDVDFKYIQEYVEKVCGIKIETLPEFRPSYNGIELYINGENEMAEDVYLKLKGLLQYFTFERLIGGN